MSEKEIKDLIKKFIAARFQMALATFGEHPWIATLYYSFDDDLNIYFLSDPKTLHCQHISMNPQVALTIADSPQAPSSKKKGVQIFGRAEKILDKQEIVHALALWRETLGVVSDAYTYEGMKKNLIDGRMYKITPKKMKFFNQEMWKEGKEPFVVL